MNIVEKSIDNYRFTLVLVITAVLLGLVSFLTMPKSEDPQLSFSIDYITAVLPGTSSLDMEQLVADPIEEALNSLEDLSEIRTDIRDGVVTIRVEFNYGTDPDKKYADIVTEITRIKDSLPSDLSYLDVKKLSPSDVNIIQLALVSESASYRDLRLYAERLEKSFERVQGVKRSDIWAIPEQEVHIKLDFEKAQHYGISLVDSYRVLQGEAKNVSGGHINANSKRFSVRTNGRYDDLTSIRETLIRSADGKPVYVRDIAEVSFGDAEITHAGRFNGQRAVFVTAIQNEGANIYDVTSALRAEISDLASNLPDDIKTEVVFDQSESVTAQLGSFFQNLGQGLLLVGLIVFVFLGARNMIVVLVIIPLSIIIGFGMLDQSGFGIEQMSIVGLIIVLGLLVDNAIVVTENIARLTREGTAIEEAARKGTSQVAGAVVSGTITTVLSFLPILAMQTSAGSFIRSLPTIVVYCLIASLIIALVFTPMFSIWVFNLKRRKWTKLVSTEKVAPIGGNALLMFARGPYQGLLTWTMNHRFVFICVSVVLFVATLMLFGRVGVSFFEKAENNRVMVNIVLPESSSLKETARVTEQVEAILAAQDSVKSYASNVGRGNPRVYYSETPPARLANRAQIFVQFNSGSTKAFWSAVASLEKLVSEVDVAEVSVKAFQQGKPIEAPVVVRLFGDDFSALRTSSTYVENVVRSTDGTINVENPLAKHKIDVEVNIDRERAALLNVSVANIKTAIRISLIGAYVGYYRDDFGDDFSILVRLAKPQGAEFSDFDKIMVEDESGGLVPLMQMATLELITVPAYIQHFDTQRSAKVVADVKPGFNVEVTTQNIAAKLEEYEFPKGVVYQIGGERKSRGEAFSGFVKSIIIALFGIFTVLVFQFRSFVQPVIVFIAIPFAISGAILALFFTGYSFSFMAFLGVAGLIGIVVNNSIILIDTANTFFDEGLARVDACRQASMNRLAPIVLTTLTTVLSLLPIAFQGSLTWSPLAWVIIGGLLVSTIISLFLVPVLYTFVGSENASNVSLSVKPV